ncbi:hypothetical protein [uncultured Fibrobacter sp.]|jgi:hypothetical protein|uniref:hypothetical protein n=1 Tax=uncultured Fibrobacter sp. TaxID=261512 RepID=UPI00260F77CB|nr:hypothetical protein [uncultured Fibrobacter sp.]
MLKLKKKSKILLLLVTFVALLFSGCAVTKKLSAADILSKTKLEFDTLSLDSASINKNLFPKSSDLKKGLLPNPHVVALVQDFARGILEKEIGKAYLTVGLNAKNTGEDTLWIRGLIANLVLDSLMELPVALRDSVKLVPGNNKVILVTEMPIDRRIFGLRDIENVHIVGRMDVSLKAQDEAFTLNFDMDRKITQEEKQALADKARTSVLDNIVSDWVGAISF